MPKLVDHEARRVEVLDATWRVIAREGIEHTTTREIAREAGCSTGVLAHYFADKDDILRSALDLAHRRVSNRIVKIRSEMAGLEALRAVLAESLPLDDERRLEINLEVSNWGRSVANPKLRQLQHGDYDQWVVFIRAVVRDAQRVGEIANDLDPHLVASLLVAFVDGLSVEALLWPERLPPSRQLMLLDRQIALIGKLRPRRSRRDPSLEAPA